MERRTLGLVFKPAHPLPRTQREAIEKYMPDSVVEVRRDDLLARRIANVLEGGGYERVVVYSWRFLGSTCRTLKRTLATIFGSGVKEIVQAEDGTVISREEWEAHKEFIEKLGRQPSKKARIKEEAILKALEALPLSYEETLKIYNAITRDDKTTLPIRHIRQVVAETMRPEES